MDLGKFEHWGVVVRPGEAVKCDPGEIYCHLSQIALQADMGNEDVRVFVKVSGQEILLGTLSVGKYPQHTTSLVFDKEFELLHTSKTSNIFAIGYKFSGLDKRATLDASTGEDSSDDEVPLAIPLYSNSDDDKSKETKSGAGKPSGSDSATIQSAKPKPNVDGNDEDDSDGDDEDSSDEDDSEYSDEGVKEEFTKKAKANISPAKTPLKTSLVKKAKIETPSKTGSSIAKKSGHVHVGTPYSSKKVKKTPNRQNL